ncbi:hypothetical protein [Spirosoma utsteinense]|uniref:Ada DNA repair metal-binding domain-containing protein n=1 Tax=Spirosoma utsteinense TaxID=2585773 RepID=A0ABR6W6J5_9BACT|nr:hypothetical protein [Spirosoma utsteinense]MBC3787905.1 hypothetical protein [Spirosoma utsteinense]MBC3792174.1 hypothetical protein [Spirosoma utsteinense]
MVTRRLLLVLFVVLTGWLPIDAQTVRGRYTDKAKRPAPRTVYVSICESRSAYAYHNGMCRGLARCTHEVSQVSEAQARNRGYKPCKICY